MEIPLDLGSQADRRHATDPVAAVLLAIDHLAVTDGVGNPLAVMYAGRIVKRCSQAATLRDRLHSLAGAAIHG